MISFEEKQRLLNEILRELSEKRIDAATYVPRLKSIYTREFRHSYSDIVNLLFEMINKENNADAVDLIVTNLKEVYSVVSEAPEPNPRAKHTFKKALFKLIDHIRLEIIHMRKFSPKDSKEAIMREYEGLKLAANKQYTENNTKIADHETKIKDHKAKIKDHEAKIRDINTQSITVLSIFSAVVMAFTGAFSLLGSAFAKIDTDMYRVVFVTLLTGFILFNTLFMLLYTIAKMTGKKIHTRCSKTRRDKCPKKCIGCNGVQRLIRKYSFVLWPNVVLLAGMLMVVVVHYEIPRKILVCLKICQ